MTIVGDVADNAIVASRDAAGAIQVNGGAMDAGIPEGVSFDVNRLNSSDPDFLDQIYGC